MEEYLLLGYITGAYGLDGTLRVLSKTDFAKERYKKGNKVFLCSQNGNRKELTVKSFRKSGQFDLVKVEEINTKEEADALKSTELQALKSDLKLKKDQYYFSDIVGCKILDENSKELGVVTVVEEYPAQLTLRVRGNNGKDFLVPFVKAFIREVDITSKKITINVIEGMLWK